MGDIAEAIIEGFFCSICGEVIDGESPGYPRECNGCDPGSNTVVANNKLHKKKKRENRKKNNDAFLGVPSGFTREIFTPYHWRVRYMDRTDKIFDIYPTNNKYHNIVTDERGTFKDLEKFLKVEFNIK